MEYEICYLIGESKEADLEKIRPEIEGIITKHKGVFSEGEFLRKRRMAYEIKGEKRGTYVARRFTIPSKDEREELYPDYDIMGEINKELRFNQNLLRYILIKTDDLPPLKDLELSEERVTEEKREFRKEEKPKVEKITEKVEEKKAEVVTVEKEEVKEEQVEEVEEVKEEKAEKKEEKIEEAAPKEKKAEPKKKVAKKKEAENILGDDIDEKLDEILNI
ncbi:MAG: 30S ribosomal protein S6 [Candidatus Moraniibacteriota bacterium]